MRIIRPNPHIFLMRICKSGPIDNDFQVYKNLEQNLEAFEIVFLSSDRDQEFFDDYYASMS